MNVFVRGTVEAGANVLHAKIKADMAAGAGEFVAEWRFAGSEGYAVVYRIDELIVGRRWWAIRLPAGGAPTSGANDGGRTR